MPRIFELELFYFLCLFLWHIFLLYQIHEFKKAEGVGFEPTSPEKGHGSPGRPVGPLRHPSSLASPASSSLAPRREKFTRGFGSLSIGGDTQSFSPSMALRHYAEHNCLRCHPLFLINSSFSLSCST